LEGSVEFLRDVIRAKTIFRCDVEFIIGKELVAFQALPRQTIESLASAFAIHIDGWIEIKQSSKEILAATLSPTFREEPSDFLRFLLYKC
jgi:hypothetical protein